MRVYVCTCVCVCTMCTYLIHASRASSSSCRSSVGSGASRSPLYLAKAGADKTSSPSLTAFLISWLVGWG